jgi:hypothetical protein
VGLTSPALIAVLAVLAGLLLIGALSFWHVLARPGVAPVLGRIAVVCAMDILVAAVVLAIANDSGGFYASWSELLGTEHVSGRVVALHAGPGSVDTGRWKGHDGQLTITSRLPVNGPGRSQAQGGKLLAVTMTGPVSGLTASGYVYVPEQVSRASRRHTALPVIVVVSDRLAGSSAVTFARQIAETAALQIAAGQLRPVLIAMLPPAIAPGAGRGCLDVPGGPQVATFFTTDLPQLIRSAFRASANPVLWAVAGDSSAAYCALQLALANSQVYSVAAAPPGYYTPPPIPRNQGTTQLLRDQDNLIYVLRHLPIQPVSVLFTGREAAAVPVLELARTPMRVAITRGTGGQWPPAQVLDWIGRLLGTEP